MNFEFSHYFEPRCYWNCGPAKRTFSLNFVTLWPTWLGNEELHKLDEVSLKSWKKFNRLIIELDRAFELYATNAAVRELKPISNIHQYLAGHRDSQNKMSRDFSVFVIPELDVVLEEHWDYNWLLQYRNQSSLERIARHIKAAGLYHFASSKLKTKQKNSRLRRVSGPER